MLIMAFDAGTKRIGVAVGDENLPIASPVCCLENDGALGKKVKKLLEEYNPGKILIGNPISLDGTERKKDFVEAFKNEIRELAGDREVIMWDERFTSRDAEEILIKADVSRKKRKKYVDKLAAVIILRSYLDSAGCRRANERKKQ